MITAGAPPPSAVLEKAQALGFEVMQVYGLTETFGHVVHCAWHDEWSDLPFPQQAEIKARQGAPTQWRTIASAISAARPSCSAC